MTRIWLSIPSDLLQNLNPNYSSLIPRCLANFGSSPGCLEIDSGKVLQDYINYLINKYSLYTDKLQNAYIVLDSNCYKLQAIYKF